MMEKLGLTLLILAALAAVWLLVTGFTVRTDVYLTDDYTVSADGSTLTFTVGVGSSMGFVRGYRDVGGDGPHRLKFYTAWGGLNSSLGAKNRFTLPLTPSDTEVWLYHGQQGFVLTLQKDAATGEWIRVIPADLS